MVLDLSRPAQIPIYLLNLLEQHRPLFQTTPHLDHLLKEHPIKAIGNELEAVCKEKSIVGYHYTRAKRSSIQTNGLILNTGQKRRDQFLREYGHLFTENQAKRVQQGWSDYFIYQQNAVRDNRIWFALTRTALQEGGAESLLGYYGGESIYMPFKMDSEIAAILQNIGEPMIVECALNSSKLNTFTDLAYGRVWLSAYHTSVNPHAHPFDVDVYCSYPILPHNILAIHILDEQM